MEPEGYSYYQRSRLDDIAKRITKQEEEVVKKVERQLEYVPDIAKLVSKDDTHTTKIENLKNIKVVRSDYESKMAELDAANANIEAKLLAVDQFIRLLSDTYVIKDSSDNIKTYSANYQTALGVINDSYFDIPNRYSGSFYIQRT
jgi:hypothetical protein